MNYVRHLLVAVALLGGSISAANAAETFATCTGFITSLPASIGTQGTWCLKGHLSTAMTTGAAIQVTVNNVTIDCNSFKIGGLAAGITTTAQGIRATDRANVTVRNCNVRGFYQGIYLNDSGDDGNSNGHLVENNQMDGNTYVGIYVSGDDSVIRGNRVRSTGGSPHAATASGIYSEGSNDVLDNLISDVTPTGGSAFGIHTVGNYDGSIGNNRVRRLLPAGAGNAYGIANATPGRITITSNHLVSLDSSGIGITCSSPKNHAEDNIISGFSVAVSNCNGNKNVVLD
jgi:parallel beta-helix repeat protein